MEKPSINCHSEWLSNRLEPLANSPLSRQSKLQELQCSVHCSCGEEFKKSNANSSKVHCGVQRTFVRVADSEQEWNIDTLATEVVKMMMMVMMMVLVSGGGDDDDEQVLLQRGLNLNFYIC